MYSLDNLPRLRLLILLSAFLTVFFIGFGRPNNSVVAQTEEPQFTIEFQIAECDFESEGANPYFILEPGYRLVLEGENEGDTSQVVITVQNKTETITLPEIGKVKTRVVEERETVNDRLVEISQNFYAICEETNDVFYFGEDVNIYNQDGTISNEGAWRAGQPDGDGLAEPGIIIPGTFLLGSRYYQEVADEIALDRAEHVTMGLTITTPAGTFEHCVKVVETTPLEPADETIKVYCPEVGLVIDNTVELVEFSESSKR